MKKARTEMKALRTVGLIGLGVLLTTIIFFGVGTVLAQGRPGGMMGGGMMGGTMAEMHAQMHNGEAMPAACTAMMADPEMMQHMMAMMHGETPMSVEACQQWMTEQGISAEDQAECLAHMAEHHPAAETTTTP
jgi:hypothetical protein